MSNSVYLNLTKIKWTKDQSVRLDNKLLEEKQTKHSLIY